jgi:hypothetical protein
VILDGNADWRLKGEHRRSSRLRVACYKLRPRPCDGEREQIINEMLAQIPV